MKLFHFPGSCSLGIHILLEEIGAPYDIVLVDLPNRGQMAPEFHALNPKGKVPTLQRDDGTVLTEFPAIAFWLAKAYPKAALLGEGLEDETRILELLDYIVGSVHMRGVTLMVMPMKFLKNTEAQKELAIFGRAEVEKGLAELSEILGTANFLRDEFTIADAALFYVLRFSIEYSVPLPANLQAYFDRLKARPSVAVALKN